MTTYELKPNELLPALKGPLGQFCSVCKATQLCSQDKCLSLYLKQSIKGHYFCLARPYTAMTEETEVMSFALFLGMWGF